VRNLQEIELTVAEQDSHSAKQSFTCTANVSNKAGNKNSDTSSENITSDMFKAFMDAHNKQMESVQKSLDSLNSLYYEEVSEGEDDYFSEEEEEIIPWKRSRIDQVSLSRFSSPRNPPVSSTCVPRVEKVDSAVQITRLGGSDVLNGNKDGCTQENVFDNLISKKLNEFSSEEKTGPKVKDSLAKMVNSLLTMPMDSSKKTELMDKYIRPKNCTLYYPRVNDIIWDLCINRFGRALDTKLHSIQKSLLKGLTPIINVVN
jgi:hypothetical protein